MEWNSRVPGHLPSSLGAALGGTSTSWLLQEAASPGEPFGKCVLLELAAEPANARTARVSTPSALTVRVEVGSPDGAEPLATCEAKPLKTQRL